MAAAIVDDLVAPTRLLGARRSRPERIAGRWEFPGGKVEPGESPVEGVHRELREELGVRVALGEEIVAPDPAGWEITPHHLMRVWWATVADGVPEPLVEHDELRWLTLDDLWDVPWLDGDVDIVRTIGSRLRGES